MPDYRRLAAQDAARYGLGPWFVNQIGAESTFDPNARSPAGALGIAQFMPATARSLGIDPLNPVQALDASAKLMAGYIKRFGSPRLALAAYNAGPGAVEKYGGVPPFAETQNYVSKVLGQRTLASGGGNPSAPSLYTNANQPAVAGGFAPGAQPQLQADNSRQNFINAMLQAQQGSTTHQRMMGLIGAVLGLRRDQASAPVFSSLGSQPGQLLAGQVPGGGKPPPGLFPVKSGAPVADLTSIGGEHPTSGLDGYPARDYFAPSGSIAVAPVSGTVVRLSGHDPGLGPTQGKGGPLGWSVYIQAADGHSYYLTHMGSRSVKVGQTVKAGQPIGTVADYARYGTPSHIHMGVR